MKRIDFVKMGFKNLWRRKLRTILTIMGVVIGTFSIVIMVSLGVGMTEGYKESMAQWGSLTKITIYKNTYIWDEEAGVGGSKNQTLDDNLINQIKAMKHVRGVTPILNVEANLKSGRYESNISIMGIEPDMAQYFDFPKMESGEWISNDNPTAIAFGREACWFYIRNGGGRGGNDNVDILNDRIKITFDDVWDDRVRPKYDMLKVAGLFEETQNEFNYNAYAPISQVEKWYKEAQRKKGKRVDNVEYQSIWVSVDDVDNVVEVQDQIRALGYQTNSMGDSLDEIKQVSNTLQLVLGGIGAVSLLVSAIGIANTMIMSIYERTKEIGVMKVLGCLVTDIRRIFLFEATIIGFCGGAVGLALSYTVSFILNKYAPEIGSMLGMDATTKISVIPLWLSLVAVAFAMGVGIISGLYPAKKATKIKPLEAIRSE